MPVTQRKEEAVTVSKKIQEHNSRSGKQTSEVQVRSWKESEITRGTHFLRAEEGTSQDMERKREGEGTHILESAEGLVRTPKQRERTRGTHSLKSAEGVLVKTRK
jgi:hypothetical protein